jgi:APA family basic amino acid/polyamine antiporter
VVVYWFCKIKNIPRGKFKTPYINSKFIAPLLLVGVIAFAFTSKKTETMAFLTNQNKMNDAATIVTSLDEIKKC